MAPASGGRRAISVVRTDSQKISNARRASAGKVRVCRREAGALISNKILVYTARNKSAYYQRLSSLCMVGLGLSGQIIRATLK